MVISAKTIAALIALALMAPAPAFAAEIREQPLDTARTDLVRVEWTADASGQVIVEHRYGLSWVAEASDLTAVQGDDGSWATSWQPGREAPTGTYRVRVETPGETVLSEEFQVQPCECVIPGQLRSRWRDGRFRLRLSAEYVSAGFGDFRLPGAPVETGRPVVRVFHDGDRIGSVRLRYRDGAFRGRWAGRQGPRPSVVFRLVSLTDAFGNS